ncbi:MAG TPA: aconitase X catalytic domain-containing protein, partial [Dehalococcoidia bacterium]|nr:aconitase X catalytic domain-containing protein [Dehalococcoidia bacterium]
MELLVRYAEALGAERFVDVTNVAGVPGSWTPYLIDKYKDAGSSYDAIFSLYDLDSDEVVPIPQQTVVHSCQLQGGYDPKHPDVLGASPAAMDALRQGEEGAVDHGVEILKTCAPYLAGNVPAFGEHCAWMESSAVIYCNSVLGARTNVEGRESTSAAMLTGKVPDWGLHQMENRYGQHLIEVEFPVESIMDWGMLGYYAGQMVQEDIPVLSGRFSRPEVMRHKHFGAAAASSGGVELYHLAGVTPEAPTVEEAFGPKKPVRSFKYGAAERRAIYDDLNSTATDTNVDFVMLGCPHAALEQIEEACRLLDGRKISGNSDLWIFTSRAIRAEAEARGYEEVIKAAGGHLLTDTCPAIGQTVPPGTKVVALDSAKQTHYLPAIMGIQAWFGSTEDCVNAAITGRWDGKAP